MTYHFSEAQLTLPQALVDRTLHTFVLANGKDQFNLIISRVDLQPEETLPALCERLSSEWRSKLPKFAICGRSTRMLDGQAAEQFECSWQAKLTQVHQWQLVSTPPVTAEFPPVNGVVLTGTYQVASNEAYQQIFEAVLSSWRWRR